MCQTATSEQTKESDKEIHSVPEFLEKILQVKKETGTETFYRGHAAEGWDLSPSIFRASEERGIRNEHLLYRDMVARLPQTFSGCQSALDYLVQMQHYELPTRLLDVTTNPLVALYFACQVSNEEHGRVYLFSVQEDRIKHYDSDTVSVLANLAKCDYEKIDIRLYEKGVPFYEGIESTVEHPTKPIPNPGARPTEIWEYMLSNMPAHKVHSDYLKWFNEQGSIQTLLHQIRAEKPHFQPLIQPCELANIFLVKAKYGNPRIINQAGAFFIFGLGFNSDMGSEGQLLRLVKGDEKRSDEEKRIYEMLPSEWIKHEVFIPHANKADILKELAQLGITNSYLFPEVDRYTRELRQRYNL
jgi:FRG domain protein